MTIDYTKFKLLKTLEGHSNNVNSVAFSPDGTKIISGSEDGIIKIWEANSGKCIQTLKGYSSKVESVAWSPDGKYIVCGGDGRHVKIWETNSWESIKTLEINSCYAYSVAWSPDGKYIVCGESGGLKIFDANSGENIKYMSKILYRDMLILPSSNFSMNFSNFSMEKSVSWSPDSKYIVSGSYCGNLEVWNGNVKIWDVNSGICIKTIKVIGNYSKFVNSVCWSPDGKYIVIVHDEGSVYIWDVNSRKCIQNLTRCLEPARSVSWSPDGKYIVIGYSFSDSILLPGCGIRIFDANSGKKIKTLKGHSSIVSSVACSPDGKYIVSGSWDKTIRIWGVK